MAQETDKLLDHNYDGIEEYDNPLPSWWVILFIITIIYSAIYLFAFHIAGFAPNQFEEMATEYKVAEERIAAAVAAGDIQVSVPEEPLTDEASLVAGQNIFIDKCAQCHLMNGGGSVGPNLTDNYWINGGSYADIVKTVLNGVPEKGMLAWQGLMSTEEIHQVTSYLMTMKGTNVTGGKEPQGEPE